MLAAILAAIMSTISSQLLVTSSALIEDLYGAITRRRVTGGRLVLYSRMAVFAVAVIAALLAWNRGETILDAERSEERRVGKECRSRWSPYH